MWTALDAAGALEFCIAQDVVASHETLQDTATYLRSLHAEVIECREKIAKLDTASYETSKIPTSPQS